MTQSSLENVIILLTLPGHNLVLRVLRTGIQRQNPGGRNHGGTFLTDSLTRAALAFSGSLDLPA